MADLQNSAIKAPPQKRPGELSSPQSAVAWSLQQADYLIEPLPASA